MEKVKNDVINPANYGPNKKKVDPMIGSHIIMILAVLFIMVPMYIMIITSVTSPVEANDAFVSIHARFGGEKEILLPRNN